MKSTRSKVLTALLAVTLVAAAALAQTAAKAGFRGAGFGQHMLNFYTDYLDLTDAQQTQIKAIITQEKPVIQPLVQQLAQTHQQLRQLEESGSFDEAKVRAVAAQQSQTMVDLIVEKARAKSAMMQVLSADQKAKLQKLESRREQRMLQHLEGPPPTSE
jgi:Spy/CpxP family protein refolding chaperone